MSLSNQVVCQDLQESMPVVLLTGTKNANALQNISKSVLADLFRKDTDSTQTQHVSKYMHNSSMEGTTHIQTATTPGQ